MKDKEVNDHHFSYVQLCSVGQQDRYASGGDENCSQQLYLNDRGKHSVINLAIFFQHNGIKIYEKCRRKLHRHATTQLLKITMYEKSVYFLRLRSPRARVHPGLTYPPGLALHFSCDLHLNPSTRTWLDFTPWLTLGSWLGAEEGSCSTLSLESVRLGSMPSFLRASSSCLSLTAFLSLKDESVTDWNTSFIFVPGFLLFLPTPKHKQSFKQQSVNMTSR